MVRNMFDSPTKLEHALTNTIFGWKMSAQHFFKQISNMQ